MKRNIIIGLAICIIGCTFAACNDEEPVVDYRYNWIGAYKYEKSNDDEISGTGTLSVTMDEKKDSCVVILGRSCIVEPNGTVYQYKKAIDGIKGHFAGNTLVFYNVHLSMHGESYTIYTCKKIINE